MKISSCEVLTVPEVAVKLRISRGLAYKAAKSGQIPSVRIGRRIVILVSELERVLSTFHVEPQEGFQEVLYKTGWQDDWQRMLLKSRRAEFSRKVTSKKSLR